MSHESQTAEILARIAKTLENIEQALVLMYESSDKIARELEISNQPFLAEDAEQRVTEQLEKLSASSDRLSDAAEKIVPRWAITQPVQVIDKDNGWYGYEGTISNVSNTTISVTLTNGLVAIVGINGVRALDFAELATPAEAAERHQGFLDAITDTPNRIPPFKQEDLDRNRIAHHSEFNNRGYGIKLSCVHDSINECSAAGCPGPSKEALAREQRLNLKKPVGPSADRIRKALEQQPPVLTPEEFERRRLACEGMSAPNWVIGAVVQVIDPSSMRYRRRGLVQQLHEDCVDIDFGDGGGDFNYYKLALITNTTVEERNRVMVGEDIDESDAIQTIDDVPMAREILHEMVEDTAWEPETTSVHHGAGSWQDSLPVKSDYTGDKHSAEDCEIEGCDQHFAINDPQMYDAHDDTRD